MYNATKRITNTRQLLNRLTLLSSDMVWVEVPESGPGDRVRCRDQLRDSCRCCLSGKVRVSEDGAIQHQIQHHEEHQQDEKGESETLVLTGHHPGGVVDSVSSHKLNSGGNGHQWQWWRGEARSEKASLQE